MAKKYEKGYYIVREVSGKKTVRVIYCNGRNEWTAIYSDVVATTKELRERYKILVGPLDLLAIMKALKVGDL